VQYKGYAVDIADTSTRFYRVDQACTRNQGGFGLGLTISKQIIDLPKSAEKPLLELWGCQALKRRD